MSTGNGLALIFYGSPMSEFCRTKGGTRSINRGSGGAATISEVGVAEEVKTFESFLDHCTFILHSSTSETTVELQKHDCLATGQQGRPDAAGLLPYVNPKNWKTILSRYSFSVADKDKHLLQKDIYWTLILSDIELDATLKSYEEGEEYIVHVVCFPQSWLSWVDNEWFLNNLQQWYIQAGMEEKFGVPSVQTTRYNEMSDVAAGRYHCRLCCVLNTATTGPGQGQTAVDVSDVRVQSGYTDHIRGILFPEGLMYVILCHLPSTYKIARHEISNLRECVLCGDERPHTDLGLVFGDCGHYICQECCKEYRNRLNEVKACFYCRKPTSVLLDGQAVSEHEPQVGERRRHITMISHSVNYLRSPGPGQQAVKMKHIMQRLQQI